MKKMLFLLFISQLAFPGTYHSAIDYIFPLPDSKLLPVESTIILKLNVELIDDIQDLSQFIAVNAETQKLSGNVFFAADNRTIIFKPHNTLPLDEFITVRVQTSQLGGHSDFVYEFQTVKNSVNDLNNLPLTKIIPAESVQNITAMTPPRVVNGVAVPSDFPKIETQQFAETAPGRIFFATTGLGDGYGNYVIICENDGTPYFYRRYDSIPRTGNLTAHVNGELSFHCYETFHIVLDQNFVEVDTIWAGHGQMADDHELQILENGNILQVVRQHIQVDMNEIVSNGKQNATVEAHHFQEMDKNQNVIFEWRAWDHLDIRDTYVSLTTSFIDFVHMNSIAIDYDGHYIISPREYKMAMKIHRDTGETIWKLGGRDSDFTLVNENLKFSFQHDVRPVPGKPNHYTLFDNGRGRNPQFSRGVEYKLDLQNMTAEKVWEYRHNPDWYSGWMGSVQRFDNGNTFVDFPSGNGRMVEVNPDGDEVWQMFVTGTNNYRCRRYEWQGEMQQPYLILENLGSVIRLIFNKFGDMDVDHYRIYTGDTSDALALLDTTSQTWFDVDALRLVNHSQNFFHITAVNSEGVESAVSNKESATVNILSPGENAITNGTFQSTDSWRLRRSGSARASGKINDNGYYQISISNGGNDLDDVRLDQGDILIMQDKDYVFEFDAYASKSRALNGKVESTNSSPINYGKIGSVSLSSRKQHFRFEFKMNYPTDTDARIVFHCGGQTGDVFIDNVSLTYSDNSSPITPLVAPWQNQDIGSPQFSGAGGLLNDRFVLEASGSDIWGQSDAFHFVYQPIDGDAEVIARVYSLQQTDPWAKAGVMIRNSLSADSRHAMMIMSAENGIAFQRRITDGGNSSSTPGAQNTTPYWVRLVRKGNLLSGYQSANGQDWERVGTATVSLNKKIYVGLAVTSHNNQVLCQAQFDHVQLFTPTRVNEAEDVPTCFALYPAFPNPFNPQTTLHFNVAQRSPVQIFVYDIKGRFVKALINREYTNGQYNVLWDGLNENGLAVASGLYFVVMHAPDFKEIHKVTVLR